MTKQNITVYTKPACVQCDWTKKTLDKLGLEYETVDVTLPENEGSLQLIKDFGYMTAPVVETADGDHWGGFQPDKLKALAN